MNRNRFILNKLINAHRRLYSESKRKDITHVTNFNAFRRTIRLIKRFELRASGEDTLQDKLNNFGNSGGYIRELKYKLAKRLWDEDKVSIDNNLGKWISVEIECFFKDNSYIDSFAENLIAAKLDKFVTIKDDGSLHNGGRHCGNDDCEECENGDYCTGEERIGKEIVVSFKYGDWQCINEVCQLLDADSAFVNKECGLHVHLDCRHLDELQAMRLGRRLSRTVPALKMMLPKSRRDNDYCRKAINDFDSDDRYAFVNMKAYNRHKTIEIRGHSGTVNAKKIVNWIKILKTIAETPNRRKVETIEALLWRFDFNESLKDYIKERANKFKRNEYEHIDEIEEDDTPNELAA